MKQIFRFNATIISHNEGILSFRNMTFRVLSFVPKYLRNLADLHTKAKIYPTRAFPSDSCGRKRLVDRSLKCRSDQSGILKWFVDSKRIFMAGIILDSTGPNYGYA